MAPLILLGNNLSWILRPCYKVGMIGGALVRNLLHGLNIQPTRPFAMHGGMSNTALDYYRHRIEQLQLFKDSEFKFYDRPHKDVDIKKSQDIARSLYDGKMVRLKETLHADRTPC